MFDLHVTVNFSHPQPPVRITSGGKTRYFLNLTQNEKCAFYFNQPLFVGAHQIKQGPLLLLTGQEEATNFEEYRSTEFSHIPVDQREPYHEVVASLWQKTHELLSTAYDDIDQRAVETKLLPNYMKECETALKMHQASNAEPLQGILFSKTEIAFLSSMHKKNDKCHSS